MYLSRVRIGKKKGGEMKRRKEGRKLGRKSGQGKEEEKKGMKGATIHGVTTFNNFLR